MKQLKFFVLGALLVSLTSCFDVLETFNIKEDGSGTYELKIDMSRAAGMLAMMKAGAGKDAEKLPAKLDSTIYTKDLIDTVTTLTAAEKAVLNKGYSVIHMNEDEGEMNFTMYYPFANAREFDIIQQTMSKGLGGNPMSALGSTLGKDPSGQMAAMGDKKPSLPTSDFTYSFTNGSIVRKVKPSSKPDKPASSDDEMPAQFKEMMKMNYITTINLPRPAKSLTGKTGTLSADKKQAKFSKTISLDDKLAPADFDFSLEY